MTSKLRSNEQNSSSKSPSRDELIQINRDNLEDYYQLLKVNDLVTALVPVGKSNDIIEVKGRVIKFVTDRDFFSITLALLNEDTGSLMLLADPALIEIHPNV